MQDEFEDEYPEYPEDEYDEPISNSEHFNAYDYEEESEEPTARTRPKRVILIPADVKLSVDEELHLSTLTNEMRNLTITKLNQIVSLTKREGEFPIRFKILSLPISDHMKSIVMKKVAIIEDMGSESSESFK
jgi:hypothetical protein